MNKRSLYATLVIVIGTLQLQQIAAKSTSEKSWSDNEYEISTLQIEYTRICLDSDLEIESEDNQQLCQLVAQDLIESTLRRAMTLDQHVENSQCSSEELEWRENCQEGEEIKYNSITDAVVAALCHMEPTLVETDYYSFFRRGDSIYSHTDEIFHCSSREFTGQSALGHFTLYSEKIDFQKYPIIHDDLSHSIQSDNRLQFVKLLDRLTESQLNSVGTSLLFIAIDTDTTFFLEKLLSRGVNADSNDEFFNHPLSYALSLGKNKAVEKLLEYGANPNVFDSRSHSSLYLAIRYCSKDIVNLLLERGADADGLLKNLSWYSISPLSMAAEFGRLDVVTRLLDKGAALNVPHDDDGNRLPSLLAQAARGGNQDIFSMLVEKGAKLPEDDLQLILSAVDGGNLNILKTLFTMGVEIPSDEHSDILFRLSNSNTTYGPAGDYLYRQDRQYQRAEQLQFLVDQGLNLEYRENGAFDYITRLSTRYSPPSQVSNAFRNSYLAERLALTKAAIQSYVDHGLDLNYINDDETLLMDAASGEYLELVKQLLSLGADKKVTTESGKSARSIVGYRLSKAINDSPVDDAKVAHLKEIYFLLGGDLAELPVIEKQPSLAEGLLRSILRK